MSKKPRTRCERLPVTATKGDRVAAHKSKMERKAQQRSRWYAANGGQPLPSYRVNSRGFMRDVFPATINRHTGKPHEHKREIARRGAA